MTAAPTIGSRAEFFFLGTCESVPPAEAVDPLLSASGETTVGRFELPPRTRFFQPAVAAQAPSRATINSAQVSYRAVCFFAKALLSTASISGPSVGLMRWGEIGSSATIL